MKTVAIISEYNPFHLGHAYHLEKIREEFGEDTAIIAIMSGNYTQRGEIAIADAYIRAEAAVEAGVQLVLKLPFPFSCSSAEYFANAGISIASSLGVVDAISFGSESGDLSLLARAAERMNTPEYQSAMKTLSQNSKNASLGHPRQALLAYESLFGNEDASLFEKPNNLLALEYLRAIKKDKSDLIAHTVHRRGNGFLETELTEGVLPSANAIRKVWMDGTANEFSETACSCLPSASRHVFQRAFLTQQMPADINRLSNVILAFLRNIFPNSEAYKADEDGGLYHRVLKKAMDATNMENLIQFSCTKKYTIARIRRLVFYILFGITSSELKEKPHYTQILAMDEVGCALLKKIKNQGQIELLTKPADYDKLSNDARRQAELDFRAEELYLFAKPVVERGGLSYRRTPYLKRTK